MQDERLGQESCSFDASYASGGNDVIVRNFAMNSANCD
ncbi:hypothetical protein EBBID32_37370 [Sphingobium indicum BiD32]|uniref:Uncharacterized protein n=1 Tax=Sphingobium indicum BiD32 TaxID=1301087 RepID=N1MQZ6_9SPHN|nr:hypothetical protein EBBID32_37370 [Sphingobium indicum BiD32]